MGMRGEFLIAESFFGIWLNCFYSAINMGGGGRVKYCSLVKMNLFFFIKHEIPQMITVLLFFKQKGNFLQAIRS